MKKAKIISIILLITCFLLTGCGESSNDYKNADDPESFIINNFQDYYNKDIVIKNTENKNDDNETVLMEIELKDDTSFSFNACSYWEENPSIPVRHYTSVNNYELIYNSLFVNDYFSSGKYGSITTEYNSIKYNDYCELPKEDITIELKDIDLIEDLSSYIFNIIKQKEVYSIKFSVKYEEEKVNLIITDQETEKTILESLSALKKS